MLFIKIVSYKLQGHNVDTLRTNRYYERAERLRLKYIRVVKIKQNSLLIRQLWTFVIDKTIVDKL